MVNIRPDNTIAAQSAVLPLTLPAIPQAESSPRQRALQAMVRRTPMSLVDRSVWGRVPLRLGLLAGPAIGRFRELAAEFGEEVETREGNLRLAQQPELAFDQMRLLYALWNGDKWRRGLRAKAVAIIDADIVTRLENVEKDLYELADGMSVGWIYRNFGEDTFKTLCTMRSTSAFESPEKLGRWLTDQSRFGSRYAGANFAMMFESARKAFAAVEPGLIAARRRSLEDAKKLLVDTSPNTRREIDRLLGEGVFGEKFWERFTCDVQKAIPLLADLEGDDKARQQRELARITGDAEHWVERFARELGLLAK